MCVSLHDRMVGVALPPMLGMVHAPEAMYSCSTNDQCTAIGPLSIWLGSNCLLLLHMHHVLLQVCSWPAAAGCCDLPLWLPLAVCCLAAGFVLKMPRGGCGCCR